MQATKILFWLIFFGARSFNFCLSRTGAFRFRPRATIQIVAEFPEKAERRLSSFPSADARRAMESTADVFATEFLLYGSLCRECSILYEGTF